MSAVSTASAPRVSLYSLLDANNASPVPTLDLGWEPFHAHMEAFLNAIDTYTTSVRTEIANRSTNHAVMQKTSLAEREEIERNITLERENEAAMLAAVANERQTISELQSSLKHIQTSLQKVKEQSAAVETELNQVRKEAKLVKLEKDRQGKVLDEQRGRDGVELQLMQDILGLRIDGVQQNQLLMRFSMIDPAAPEKEFSLIVDVSKVEYDVPNCDPPIADMAQMVHELNADRDFFGFIKKIRKAFRAMVPEPVRAPSKFDDMAGPGSRSAQIPAELVPEELQMTG